MSKTAERCHRCGSPAKLGYDSGNENWNQKWWYECAAGCGARGHSFDGSNSWYVVDAEDEKAEKAALEWWNKRAPVVATADGLPQFPARHLRVSSLGKKIQLSLLLDALEPANDYLVIPVNPCVVRP